MIPFRFIENVPAPIRDLLRDRVQEWIDRGDYPVCEFELPNGVKIDLCRRPWPPGIPCTVGAERETDELAILAYLASTQSND